MLLYCPPLAQELPLLLYVIFSLQKGWFYKTRDGLFYDLNNTEKVVNISHILNKIMGKKWMFFAFNINILIKLC
jgi:hypothetical protein